MAAWGMIYCGGGKIMPCENAFFERNERFQSTNNQLIKFQLYKLFVFENALSGI
jgi:hypothetical protein